MDQSRPLNDGQSSRREKQQLSTVLSSSSQIIYNMQDYFVAHIFGITETSARVFRNEDGLYYG
jgi:hypothetical protein